jgi:hypothetical protein
MKNSAESDFCSNNPPGDDFIALVAARFHFALPKEVQTNSVLQRYYVRGWPYYFVLLLAPFLAGLALIFPSLRKYALLLFIHISLLVTVSVTFGGHSVRFFQPVSFGALLVVALLAKGGLAHSRKLPGGTRSEKDESPVGPIGLSGHSGLTEKMEAGESKFLLLEFPSKFFAICRNMRHPRGLVP